MYDTLSESGAGFKVAQNTFNINRRNLQASSPSPKSSPPNPSLNPNP